jgi:hypothetical protein
LIGDSQEAAVEALELAGGFLVGESSAVHLQKGARSSKRLADTGEAGCRDRVGSGEYGRLVGLGCMLAGRVKLAL